MTLEELFTRFPSVQQQGFTGAAYKPGLDGMRRFDSVLGSPWKNYRCIHVAGTNGKGSVCSMMTASLSASGFRTGLFTSPHIVDFTERMRLVSPDGRCEFITMDEVRQFLDLYEPQMEGLSFFEITTGMAFWWFAKRKVDYAVVEVGLGGLLDSTNIITPEISVITSIGLDHCSLLGNSRQEIALQKAGIFKAGVPAVVGFKDEETGQVFTEVARQTGCPLYFVEEPLSEIPDLDLEGPCQDQNYSTAARSLEIIGISPIPEAMARTAEITSFHGRWERLSSNPEVIADIGHNPPALQKNFGKLEASGRPLAIVYGVMADKDLASISAYLPQGAKYFLCAPNTPRALPVDRLFLRIGELRPELDCSAFDSVSSAVGAALEYAEGTEDCLVYIGGSTFVVTEAVVCFSDNS